MFPQPIVDLLATNKNYNVYPIPGRRVLQDSTTTDDDSTKCKAGPKKRPKRGGGKEPKGKLQPSLALIGGGRLDSQLNR